MGLLADALARQTVGAERCAVMRAIDDLDDETRDEFDQYVQAILAWRDERGERTPGGPNVGELRLALRRIGIVVSPKTLGAHVAGRCTCGVD